MSHYSYTGEPYTPEQIAFLEKVITQFGSLMTNPQTLAYMAASVGLNALGKEILSGDPQTVYQNIYTDLHNPASDVIPDVGTGPFPYQGPGGYGEFYDTPPEEDMNAGGGLDWATLNLQSIIAAQQAELARQQLGSGFLEQIMDTQRDPFSIVPALQLYGGAGGGTLAPHAALAAGGGAIQQSPYGDIAQKLIDSLAQFTGGANPPVTGTWNPPPGGYEPIQPPVGGFSDTTPYGDTPLTEPNPINPAYGIPEYDSYGNPINPNAPPRPPMDLTGGPLPEPEPTPTYTIDPKTGAKVPSYAGGGTVVSDEPMLGVGAYSGLARFLLGEKGPEKMRVTPMAHGGSVSVSPSTGATVGTGTSFRTGATPGHGIGSRGKLGLGVQRDRTSVPIAKEIPGYGAPPFGGNRGSSSNISSARPAALPLSGISGFGAPAFGTPAAQGRQSLADVFARSARPGDPLATAERQIGQQRLQRQQQMRGQQEASTRIQAILDALQSYTASPQAAKRRKRGMEMLPSGY